VQFNFRPTGVEIVLFTVIMRNLVKKNEKIEKKKVIMKLDVLNLICLLIFDIGCLYFGFAVFNHSALSQCLLNIKIQTSWMLKLSLLIVM
jgi:hypothetical protein